MKEIVILLSKISQRECDTKNHIPWKQEQAAYYDEIFVIAWDAISRYIYTALQGGSIMHGWTNDDHVMIICCNDGTRPVIFRIERIDIG